MRGKRLQALTVDLGEAASDFCHVFFLVLLAVEGLFGVEFAFTVDEVLDDLGTAYFRVLAKVGNLKSVLVGDEVLGGHLAVGVEAFFGCLLDLGPVCLV